MERFNKKGLEETIDTLFAPPYWPIKIKDFPADVRFFDIERERGVTSFDIGRIHVSLIDGCHPGGCSIFRIDCGDKSVVYATDFEHSDKKKVEQLIALAKDADIMIYDGQYTDEEFKVRKGYGHSTYSKGIEIAKASGVKELILTHHDPMHDDNKLDLMEKEATWCAKGEFPVHFARAGETRVL